MFGFVKPLNTTEGIAPLLGRKCLENGAAACPGTATAVRSLVHGNFFLPISIAIASVYTDTKIA